VRRRKNGIDFIR